MMVLEVEWKEILDPLNERNSANMQERINKCYIIVIRDMAFNLTAIKNLSLSEKQDSSKPSLNFEIIYTICWYDKPQFHIQLDNSTNIQPVENKGAYN